MVAKHITSNRKSDNYGDFELGRSFINASSEVLTIENVVLEAEIRSIDGIKTVIKSILTYYAYGYFLIINWC